MKRSRLATVVATAALGAASFVIPAPPAAAEPCEGVDCVTGPAGAALCLVEHAKQIKQYLDDCLTQPA